MTLLGLDEACDPEEVNSAALGQADSFTVLIDCRYSAVPSLWRGYPDPEAIDSIYPTHYHADDVLGLVLVLHRWGYDGRCGSLTIFTTEPGITQLEPPFVAARVPIGLRSQFLPELRTPDGRISPFEARTALTQLASPNHATRLEADGRHFAYSGDGRPTDASRALFADADLLMHECWSPEVTDNAMHCDLPTARTIAGPSRIGHYYVRAGSRTVLREMAADDHQLFFPEAAIRLEV